MADVTSWIGPATSLIAAVGALPLAGLVQNRGEARIRNSIASSMKTIKELDDLKLPNDTELKQKLQQCLDDDLSALTQLVTSRNERKERNVPSLAVGFVFGAGLTIPLWFMWEPQKWWTWLIFGTLAFLAAIMFLGALLAWRKPPNPPKEKKLKSGAV